MCVAKLEQAPKEAESGSEVGEPREAADIGALTSFLHARPAKWHAIAKVATTTHASLSSPYVQYGFPIINE